MYVITGHIFILNKVQILQDPKINTLRLYIESASILQNNGRLNTRYLSDNSSFQHFLNNLSHQKFLQIQRHLNNNLTPFATKFQTLKLM